MPGGRFNGRTRSLTEFTSQFRTAWASRPATFEATKLRAKGWSSGADRSSPIPSAKSIAEAPHDKEAVLVAEVDIQRIEDVRRNWPFWRDRRVDAYGGITERFGV